MDENGRTSERVLEQLRLLLDVVASRAQGYLNGIDADDASARCSGSAACGWCPLCAAVSFARGGNPELAAQLGEQVTGLVALLRQLLEQQTGADADEQRAQPPEVQHIDVQRVGGSAFRDGAFRDGAFRDGAVQPGPVAERTGEREC